MRRPNAKWLFKSTCLLLISGALFLLFTSWLSASPYTNRPQPSAKKLAQHQSQQQQKHNALPVDYEDIGDNPAENNKIIDSREHKIDYRNDEVQNNNDIVEENKNERQVVAPTEVKKDWHDWIAMDKDAKRVGIGEHGKPAHIEDESQRDEERRISLENGFNALLSDSISVNRSVPDIRYKGYVGFLLYTFSLNYPKHYFFTTFYGHITLKMRIY